MTPAVSVQSVASTVLSAPRNRVPARQANVRGRQCIQAQCTQNDDRHMHSEKKAGQLAITTLAATSLLLSSQVTGAALAVTDVSPVADIAATAEMSGSKGNGEVIKDNLPDVPSKQEVGSFLKDKLPDVPSPKDVGDSIKSSLPGIPSDIPNEATEKAKSSAGALKGAAKDAGENVKSNLPDTGSVKSAAQDAGDVLKSNLPDSVDVKSAVKDAANILKDRAPSAPTNVPSPKEAGDFVKDRVLPKIGDTASQETPVGKQVADYIKDPAAPNLPNPQQTGSFLKEKASEAAEPKSDITKELQENDLGQKAKKTFKFWARE